MFSYGLLLIVGILSLSKKIAANTEKVLFTSPKSHVFWNTSVPQIVLDSTTKIGRTVIDLETPWSTVDSAETYSVEQWFSVEGLGSGWNYEARVCWPATVRIKIASSRRRLTSRCRLSLTWKLWSMRNLLVQGTSRDQRCSRITTLPIRCSYVYGQGQISYHIGTN